MKKQLMFRTVYPTPSWEIFTATNSRYLIPWLHDLGIEAQAYNDCCFECEGYGELRKT